MVKKILIATGSLLVLLVTVLVVHIYMVTRPKVLPLDAVALARIDFKQPLTQDDVAKIKTWFKNQNGIQEIKCYAASSNAIFTFYPAKIDATKTVATFAQEMHYNATRFLPSKEEMMKGCPVAMK